MAKKVEEVSLSDYWDMLNKHDWWYEFSDDRRVYNAAACQDKYLRAVAKQSQEHQSLFEGFHRHHFTGKPWDNEQSPKPAKPE
jgi:hypothetical protein